MITFALHSTKEIYVDEFNIVDARKCFLYSCWAACALFPSGRNREGLLVCERSLEPAGQAFDLCPFENRIVNGLQISFALIRNLGKTMGSLSRMSEKIRFKIRA